MMRFALLVLMAAPAAAQNFDKVEIKPRQVSGNVWMLQGAGGNIGVCAGDDGVFLIDDQFAPLTEKIRAAVKGINDGEIRFLLNTHWHGDHTGGNENLGKGGTVIVAHENVRKRLSTEQFMKVFGRKVPPSPKAALPVVTFPDRVSFHLNGDTIAVFHVEHAHTDGDSVVRFEKANVVHMGDTFFNGFYPFVDLDSGGSLDGIIKAAELVHGKVDGETKIIPGHGPLGDKAALGKYVETLKAIRGAVKPLVDAGRTLDEVKAADPLAPWNDTLGKGFMKPDVFLGIVYRSLTGK